MTNGVKQNTVAYRVEKTWKKNVDFGSDEVQYESWLPVIASNPGFKST